jgi:hypothetical protein
VGALIGSMPLRFLIRLRKHQQVNKGWRNMLKNYVSFLTLLIAACMFTQSLQANDAKAGEETQIVNGLEIPLKCPKVRKEYLESFQKNRNNAELLAAYNEQIGLYVERDAIQTANDPKEARRAEEKLKKINSRLDRNKKKLFNIAKKMRRPIDKKYEAVVKKFEGHEEKAKRAEERGQEKMAMKHSQDAAKISQSMISLKNSIDMINYHLFFDEYEPKPQAEVDKGDKKKK